MPMSHVGLCSIGPDRLIQVETIPEIILIAFALSSILRHFDCTGWCWMFWQTVPDCSGTMRADRYPLSIKNKGDLGHA